MNTEKQCSSRNLYAGDWESLLADRWLFTTNGRENPPGKATYVEAARRFLRVAKSVELKELIVEGDKASVVTRYALQSPKGNTDICDVAEIFSVKNGEIQSNSIIFDLAAFQEFTAKGWLSRKELLLAQRPYIQILI